MAQLPNRPPPDGLGWVVTPSAPERVYAIAEKHGIEQQRIEISGRACTTFGRNSDKSDVGLDHPSLSRVHAAIARDNAGDVYVVDLKSSHGTFVNGQRLNAFDKVPVKLGEDIITFGGSSREWKIVTGSSSARRSDADDGDHGQPMPPPPRRAAVEDEDEEAIARRKFAERRAREAEIQAAISSMSAPVLPSLFARRTDSSVAASSSSSRGAEKAAAGSEDADNDAEVMEGEEAEDLGAGMGDYGGGGLPMAFGSGSGGVGAKRPRPTSASDARGAAGSGDDHDAHAGTARQRHDNEADEEDNDGDDDDGYGPSANAGASSSSAAATVADVASRLKLPISHEVVLSGHSKTVTTIALDPGGARLISGGNDYVVRLYDFGGMDRNHKSFREVIPLDGQPVHQVNYSTTGDRFVVATSSAKFKVYDRDAKPLVTTVKGDPYMNDMSNTKGHTAAVTSACWHPNNKDMVMTSSLDGSCRLWDTAHGKTIFDELTCGDVIKFKTKEGKRAQVTAAGIDLDGRCIVGAVDDGSIQLFYSRSTGHKYPKFDAAVRNAHAPGETTCVVFSPDRNRFATRSSADNTLKIWDLRKFSDRSGPVAVISGLDCKDSSANCAFSPDCSTIIAGTAVASKGAGAQGRILVFEAAAIESATSASPVGVDASTAASYSAGVAEGHSAVAVLWHPKINQIAVGCGDGSTRVLYDPQHSEKGALLSSAKAPKKRDMTDYLGSQTGAIYAPNVLPLYREAAGPVWANKKGRKEEDDRTRDAKNAKVPTKVTEIPEFLAKGRKTFTEHFMQTHKFDVNLREQDPQKLLQAYATKGGGAAGSETALFTKAYASTQPKQLLAETTLEEEIEAAKSKKQKQQPQQ